MNTYRNMLIMVVMLVLIVFILGAGAVAAAGEQVTPFTGSEMPPSAAACAEAGGWLDFDGACALAYLQAPTPTPDGQHLEIVRVSYWRDQSTDPRLTGYNTVEANLFLNTSTGHGHIWGTWRLLADSAQGSGWEGTWNGQLFPDRVVMVATGRGTGSFEGLIVQMKIVNGSIEGIIIE